MATRVDALPDDLLRHVLRFCDLKQLNRLCPCSNRLLQIIRNDSRWLPIIAPPALAHQKLTMAEHGDQMRLMFAQYLRWIFNWNSCEPDELRAMGTALDGYFALAPWHRIEPISEVWAPLPWLQRIVHGPEPPPRPALAMLGGRRRSSRLAERTPDDEPSSFFQQRERDDEDAFRDFFSFPVQPPPRPAFTSAKRCIVQAFERTHTRKKSRQ